MAKKNNTSKTRTIGKQKIESKKKMDPKLKSRIWTIIILLILLVFFIVNNTRDEPEQGPYPPNYVPGTLSND